ncbi:MAG: acetylglutamate kinase [Cyclobacteriaceae bacterium]|nr:acetylglutamate kinase [Cyclobacteriaceae bacterium]
MKKEPLYVIKVGGNVIENPEMLQPFLKAFSQLQGYKLLVHGGGKVATALASQLGYPTQMVEGRRMTDDNMLRVVTMTYGGLVNKSIVAQLQSLGCNALGMTGADGNLMLSVKRPLSGGHDYGWVGDPVQVNAPLLTALLVNQQVPVIAPLTHDGKGNLLNTNADTMANTLAGALAPVHDVHLVYAFELNGVMEDLNDPSSLIPKIDRPGYQALKEKGSIHSGMIPKLDNAFDAIDKGASSVRIINYQSINQLNNEEYNQYTIVC